MTRTMLAKHYSRSTDTIDRWCREMNVRAMPAIPFGSPKAADRIFGTSRVINQREQTPAGRAAAFLQHYGPIFRCDVRGMPLQDGFFWSCGRLVLSDDELIERAEEKRARDARRRAA